MKDDRERWDERYRNGAHTGTAPSEILKSLQHLLPPVGREPVQQQPADGPKCNTDLKALDMGGGCGRNALWLAQQGWRVTLADVSPVALGTASNRANDLKLPLTTQCVDVDEEPFPAGPWDLILTCLFLWRPLFAMSSQVLAPHGRLVIIQPTRRNLERHPKPPLPFLLQEGELARLAPPLEIEYYSEGWSLDGRHDAVLVARRP